MQRENRRLAAIVAADIVGYSRLVGFDEEGTLQALRRLRAELIMPLVAKYGGRIANTAGDSYLLDFPSVVDAVRCALTIQQALAKFNKELDEDRHILFRIGIHLGDVIAEGDDLLGDGVNIAARLENLCAPGGLALSEDAYRQVRDRLEMNWRDGGEHLVKNIARPVHVWFWSTEGEANKDGQPAGWKKAVQRPSIAVVPFVNMSGDPEQDYFANGITEDIVTELSRFSWLRIVSLNSSFSSKDLRDIAEELGVRYILEGSVRKAGQRVRTSIQLINAVDGTYVWRERYDRELTDIFDLQDEITHVIASSIAPQMMTVEVSRARERGPEDLEGWDLVVRAAAALSTMSKSGLKEAEMFLDQALAIDPNDASALAYKASGRSLGLALNIYEDPVSAIDEAKVLAKRALTIEPNNCSALTVLARVAYLSGEHVEAYRYVRQAIASNPNNFNAQSVLGIVLAMDGQAEDAKEVFEEALRINPQNAWAGLLWAILALAEYCLGNYAAGIDATKRAEELSLDYPWNWAFRAACHVRLDQADLAQAAIDKCLQSDPGFSLKRVSARKAFSPRFDLPALLADLSRAGLPE